jgi:hypothetical protein
MTRIPSRATPRKTSMLEIRLEMIVGDAVVIGPAISSSRGNRQDSIAIGMVLMNSDECLVQEALNCLTFRVSADGLYSLLNAFRVA